MKKGETKLAHYVKFMRGTPDAYKNLAVKDNDTLYFISSEKSLDGALYLGSKLISGESEGLTSFTLNDLEDVLISEGLENRALLMYSDGQWRNVTPDELVFIGASADAKGLAGLVPAPEKGKTNLFLRSDGNWAEITVENAVVADANVITIENRDEASAAVHAELIQAAIQDNDLTIANGDIIIIKDLIVDNKWQYTSYVYDGTNWAAMDGNYDAENVYFKDDILVTTTIGTITKLENGQATLQSKGKNIKQVLSSLLAERKNPKATAPSATISLTNSGTYEMGTKITPAWKTTFDPGSYTYGPATGVVDAGGSVVSTNDTTATSIEAGKLAGATGTRAEYQVADGVTYKVTLTYGWTAGEAIPVDNFGDEYVAVKINTAADKTHTSSNSITGYRAWFKGGLASGAEVALTSDLIRGLGASSAAVSSGEVEIKAADYEGCKRVVVAMPVSSNKTIQKVYLKSASNADITSEFVKQSSTLEVEGAEGFTSKPYNVWVYEPASLDASEVYTVVIG